MQLAVSRMEELRNQIYEAWLASGASMQNVLIGTVASRLLKLFNMSAKILIGLMREIGAKRSEIFLHTKMQESLSEILVHNRSMYFDDDGWWFEQSVIRKLLKCKGLSPSALAHDNYGALDESRNISCKYPVNRRTMEDYWQ